MAGSMLERLLDDNARFDVGGRGTANHLPMALIALSRMGAPDQRLVEYFRWWEDNRALPRQDSGRRVDRQDWRQHVGDAAMFDALADCFRRWAIERGGGEVVGMVFSEVSGGVAAVALHGLIRLAYGLEAEHPGETGAGLAAICSRYVDLGIELDRALPASSAASAFGRLARAIGGASFAGGGIIGRMRTAAADRRFVAGFSRPPLGPALLDDLAGAAIALYWQTGDFTVLHMVTATHAARVLFTRFPELATTDAIGALWGAVCAAYASIGAPPPAELPLSSETLPWTDIFGRAIPSNDSHVIKMTYTCHSESARYGSALYRAVAARLVAAGTA